MKSLSTVLFAFVFTALMLAAPAEAAESKSKDKQTPKAGESYSGSGTVNILRDVGLKVDGPFGPFVFRAIVHQSMLGAFVGKIALKNGHGTMVDFKYVDGASALPSDAEVKKLRSASD